MISAFSSRASLAFSVVLLAASTTGCSANNGEDDALAVSQDLQCAVTSVEGVDVSEYQGAINWGAVKASGRGFAITRVSDGVDHLDPTFGANWAGIKSAGMVRGVYQFFRPEQDPIAQADLLLSSVALTTGDLSPVLDVEVTDGVSGAGIQAGIRAWSARINQATGRKPIIYTAPGFWDGLGADSDFGTANTLWVADWGVPCPVAANSWSSWTLWQYADNGSVPGISGLVDTDRFDGTLAELTTFADGAAFAGANAYVPNYRGMARDETGAGYWILGSDGGMFTYGDASFEGSLGGSALNAPVMGVASTPTGKGYWIVAADGGLFTFGDAEFLGSLGGKTLNAAVVGIAPTPSGKGYWIVASDGGLFSFGDAAFYGSMGGKALNAPVVGMASTSTGKGYWLVAADGGLFSFGDAQFYGSMGSAKMNASVVGIAATPTGKGYWLVGSDGGVFCFGDAAFYGSMGGKALNAPVVGITATPSGKGYWLVGGDGGLFTFGDAQFHGSRG